MMGSCASRPPGTDTPSATAGQPAPSQQQAVPDETSAPAPIKPAIQLDPLEFRAAWRGGCVEVELEVSGRHEFRVARVVAETGEATQIHDADGEQRATRAAHAVKLRIACAAPKARPASPVNVVDSPDSVPESRVPAVRVLVLVE